MASSVGSSSGRYAASVTSSRSSASRRLRTDNQDNVDGTGEDILDRRSSLENGIFGVLFTLRKENTEARVRIRWVILKIILDAWQLFTTVVAPSRQAWSIRPNSPVWVVVSVLNFEWLSNMSYGAYLVLLYVVVGLLVLHLVLCVWVAWCFKEQKFPVVWPLKALRIFSSVVFQAFDVAAMNILELGITCRYTGNTEPHLRFDIFPEYSCGRTPHIIQAVISGLSLGLFVAIALLTNMAEVEVDLLSRRPLALGHSGPVVFAFAIKVLLTLVHVFIGWPRVEASLYLGLSLAFAYQFLRWNPHLVTWVNYLRGGVAVMVVWCSGVLMLLEFHPGISQGDMKLWANIMTYLMLGGLLPAFGIGALISRGMIQHMTKAALNDLKNAKPNVPLEDICQSTDDPRDVEVVARCCRVWKDKYTVDPVAVDKARQVIQAGVAMFPNSAFMVLLQANFMIDVLGVSQNGSRRIEDARKLNPGLMCRFIMFVRQQQASQQAVRSHTGGRSSMDLLAYVEYQRKQRMVVRLHREALQAMCNFWKSLDTSKVSFTYLSKALSRIESSVSQAQTAYRVVLESYGNNPKLVRLYGRFLQTIKNDPWRAAEYFTEADRLEEVQNGDSGGPLLPDGTPLGRMDEISTAVLVISAQGEVQMANRHAHILFGHKRGMLEGKPMATLLAPHFARWLSDHLASLVNLSAEKRGSVGSEESPGGGSEYSDTVVVGMHSERLAFPVKLAMRKASGVCEDSTFIVMLDVVPPVQGTASLWVTQNGTIVACDPSFVMSFGWKPHDVNGAMLSTVMTLEDTAAAEESGEPAAAGALPMQQQTYSANHMLNRLLRSCATRNQVLGGGVRCLVAHKYDSGLVSCIAGIVDTGLLDTSVHEVKLTLAPESGPGEMLVVNRKGVILHVSSDLAASLSGVGGDALGRKDVVPLRGVGGIGNTSAAAVVPSAGTPCLLMGSEKLAGFTLCDFLQSPWKDMHLVKYLKGTTSMSQRSRSPWACRKEGALGPALELRTTGGTPLFMRVSVTTADVGGELNHIIRMAKSSLEDALGDRRLRLRTSHEGVISDVVNSPAAQLLGLDCSKMVGRAVWDFIDWSSHTASGTIPAGGPAMFSTLLKQALLQPGHSWRVQVSVSTTKAGDGMASELMAMARASMIKSAVMQVHVDLPTDTNTSADANADVSVDLWLLSGVSGLLEVDMAGRIRAVLEEQTRPAGLLFGVPTPSLVGTMLGELVALPQGSTRPSDLLNLHGVKKSSLKATTSETSVKVGPVHVLEGCHKDGLPNAVEVQGVGRPGGMQTFYIILRSHTAPLPQATAARTATAPAAAASAAATLTASRQPQDRPSPARPIAASIHRPVSNTSFPAATARSPRADEKKRAALSRSASVVGGQVSPAEKGSSSGVLEVSTPSLQPHERRVPGDSSGAIWEDAPADPMVVPVAPDGLQELANGLPVPVVAPLAVKGAAIHTARDNLDDLLRAQDGSHAVAASPKVSELSVRRTSFGGLMAGKGGGEDNGLRAERPRNSALPVDIESMDGDKDEPTDRGGKTRISTWVASKGAFYQNSVLNDDDRKSDDDGALLIGSDDFPNLAAGADIATTLIRKASGIPGGHTDGRGGGKPYAELTAAGGGEWAKPRAGPPPPPAPYDDDDAISEGGQSAMSGQSGDGGADYKRGKRFRKLMKLMDSGQTQQVQQRYRFHALLTVALLAAVHIVCFGLTINAILTKRDSMLQLGRSGQSQRFMHQILTDVRSLDVISKKRNASKLYNPEDAPFFIDRIADAAEQVKVRFKEILDSHHASAANVRSLLFFSTRTVWNGKDSYGQDSYTNVTIWDFTTRFYSMAMTVHQHGLEWVQNGVDIADNTTAGQFLIKSGPDLWRASRQVLDALLYVAVDDARWVNNLQIVFLCVEGAAVTSIAACYLAFLLKTVAAQRYKLYNIFVLIPLGLTRALASQNTNLVVDEEEDDDDDMDDLDDKASSHVEEPEGDAAAKQKRRAVFDAKDTAAEYNSGGGGAPAGRGTGLLPGAKPSEINDLVVRMNRSFRSRNAQLLTATDSPPKSRGGGFWDRASIHVRQLFGRRPGGRVAPLRDTATDAGLSKRQLKYDSHDTGLLLMPFVLWSALVVTVYTIVVIQMRGIVNVLAVHSVVNFMSARTYRAVFFCQELAATENLSYLSARRAAVTAVWKVVRDAWYTLQLGADAYRATGPNTERFPLVTSGVAYASPLLSRIFYENGHCHRVRANLLPCPGPTYRFYQSIYAGLDSIMHHYLMYIDAMGSSTSPSAPGLDDDSLDFIYNVGTKDLIDGTVEIQEAHQNIIMALFEDLFIFHVILLVMFWIIFGGFLFLLLNPLLRRISRERLRIAELVSQLPLELDVEKLVAKALGAASTGSGPVDTASVGVSRSGDTVINGMAPDQDNTDAVSKWKNIIRQASSQLVKAQSGSLRAGGGRKMA